MYNKPATKHEVNCVDRGSVRSEMLGMQLVNAVTLAECGALYPKIRQAGQTDAIHWVSEFQYDLAQNFKEVTFGKSLA